MRGWLVCAALGSALCVANPAAAQVSEMTPNGPVVIDGSPAPELPEMLTRDSRGRATVRAVKLSAPLRVDGQLDEAVYGEVPPFDGLLQAAPDYGANATEKTDIWITFDADYIYVSARCWDTAPSETWIANELRRDTNQLRDNENFGVMFDTYYDRRSGFFFYANPLGAMADYTVVDEGGPNKDWNPVWDVRTGRFEGGWTVEMAIPFKTLRYRAGSNQIWGIQLRRAVRYKNEWTYLTPVPQNMAGPMGFNRVSSAGTLVGLDLPPASRNVELKPYAISRLTTDRLATPRVTNDFKPEVGGDFKYGVTANLTADVTINTDFAQVEVDEQQVNLTRFTLFFPEKRDFFLEGQGTFDFARGGSSSGFFFPGGGSSNTDTPYLFYSRSIGLTKGREVPIVAGGRLTGKVGPFGVGVMNIQTGDEEVSNSPTTNFTVVRVKRDILRRSTIGAMLTNRSASLLAPGRGGNQGYGVDGSFAFYQNVSLGAYYARTSTPGLNSDDDSYQARFEYGADRYGARLEYLKVGDNFNPEVGFIRRDNFGRSFASARFSPRPRNSRLVRKYTTEASLEYVANGADFLESRQQTARFGIEFNSSDRLNVEANRNFDFLIVPFTVVRGATIPVGAYSYDDASLAYSFGAQRRLSGTVTFSAGEYYDGDIRTLSYSGGRVSVSERLSLEPSFSVSRLDLPTGEVTTTVVRSRADYGFSPRMFASGLVQYNSTDRIFSSNLRFRWEYRPGSEFFVVWTDERDTRPNSIGLRNRAFVVKATRLLRF